MKTTPRREFIRQGSVALLAGLSIGNAETDRLEIPRMPDIVPDIPPDRDQFWDKMRGQFILANDLTYLNNGTMGPSPFVVYDKVRQTMTDIDKNLSYGGWEASQKKIAAFVGADENEIALTTNVTQGINIACWGLPLKRGDEVIMTTQEHAGSAIPWLNRQKLDGIVIHTFTPAMTAAETVKRAEALMNKHTRAIAIPHIPCSQGQIMPIKEITAIAKSKGIFVFIDGAHGPGMLPLNLHDINCDAYASCCHKWMLGPKGTGFLYVRKDFQDTLQAIFMGAGGDNGKWNMATDPITSFEYYPGAHRYYGGTMNISLYKGVDTAIDFINEIGMNNISRRIQYLSAIVQTRLMALGNRIEMLTPTEDASRGGVVGFRVKGKSSAEIYQLCGAEKVRIRHVPENGMDSLRVSTHIYNSRTDIDRFIGIVQKALG